MAKIKIDKDTFDVCERIKKLDKNYFVVYDTVRRVYEIHNSKQIFNTYCITAGRILDMRVLEKLVISNVSNLDKIMTQMQQYNEKLEQENKRRIQDLVTWRAQEMYDYSIRNNTDNFDNAYSTNWV